MNPEMMKMVRHESSELDLYTFPSRCRSSHPICAGHGPNEQNDSAADGRHAETNGILATRIRSAADGSHEVDGSRTAAA